MHPELTNLLPADRQKRLRRDYFWRFGTVLALSLAVLIIIHGILLIPTHEFLAREIAVRTQNLAALDTTTGTSDSGDLSARLASLSLETAALGTLSASSSESLELASLLAVTHPGVHLTSITLTPVNKHTPAGASLVGTADTRDTLRAYYLALSNTPSITSANLPVSAYALSSDIPFTITLTLP